MSVGVTAEVARRAAELCEERARELLGRALAFHRFGYAASGDALERRAHRQLVAAAAWRDQAARLAGGV